MRRDDSASPDVSAPAIARRPWSQAQPASWADSHPVPAYLALREGTRPFVFVAPHGGLRLRPIRRGDSVNDLETAEIAWELAERLDAHAIVNHGLDRNEIDLNRISHLTTSGSGILALLGEAIAAASRGGEVPFVLFVHGWNMVVPCCDIGVGLRRRAGHVTGRFPTLSRRRFLTDIAAIERELARRGLSASIGRRYTASGRDNAAQLFSGRHAHHETPAVDALARLATSERVDAAQLELGIPLRWKGPLRDAFLEGMVEALSPGAASEPAPGAAGESLLLAADESSVQTEPEPAAIEIPRSESGWRLPPVGRDEPPRSRMEPGYSLQAVLDPESGLAIFGGVEATGPQSMLARLSLVWTDGTMMLLVGENEWDGESGHYALEGFEWRVTDSTTRIRVDARLVRYTTHDAYLDLEKGLASSQLVEARLDLELETFTPEHGRLRGTVETMGRMWVVDSIAFLDRGARRGASVEARVRVALSKPDGSLMVVRSRTDAAATLQMDHDAGRKGVIRSLAARGNSLRVAEVLARVPVWRPLANGSLVRWTFGIARCRFDDGTPDVVGLFDSTDVYGPPAPTPLEQDDESAI